MNKRIKEKIGKLLHGTTYPAPKPPVYRMEGEYVWFGECPQSLKAPHVRITAEKDGRGYHLGSDGAYYAEVTATPYEGGEPIFVNGEQPLEGATYYFKVEPIKWRMLRKSDTTALLLCESILEACAFREDWAAEDANNYERSDVRAWLNGAFTKAAFTQEQQATILISRVDNSAASTGESSNKYACEDTLDKIFLPSVAEITDKANGFSEADKWDEARIRRPTDYAVANGAYRSGGNGSGWWWLRSPGDHYDNFARHVSRGGFVDDLSVLNPGGAVPALQIRL